MPRFRSLTAIVGAFLLAATARAEMAWHTLEPGLELSRVKVPGEHRAGDGNITLVRIDPARKLVLAMARFEGEKNRTAAEWAREKRLVFAVNAGLYQADHSTNVGLMRDGAKVNNPTFGRNRSVFAFNSKGGEAPALLWDRDCEQPQEFRRYETLIQNIRLVDCKKRVTWRSAEKEVSLAVLALDGSGRIVVAFSQSPHTAPAFARRLLRLPLDLRRAQYLEGGRPAQLYLDAGGVKLDLNGLCGGTLGCIGVSGSAPEIPNIIGVVKR